MFRKFESQHQTTFSFRRFVMYVGAFAIGSIILITDRLVSCTVVTGRSMQVGCCYYTFIFDFNNNTFL